MKKLKTLAICATLLAGASAAQAADIELNVWGASAQFLFWNDVSDSFLTNVEGCSNIVSVKDTRVDKAKNAYTMGTNCTNRGNKSIIIRYSSKASYDGVKALLGTAGTDKAGTIVTAADFSTVITGSACANPNERPMADETVANQSNGFLGALKCVPVNVGASDVAADMFTQVSGGSLKGPLGGAATSRSNLAVTVDPAILATKNPVVVPFGFFVNKGVTYNKCVSGNANAGTLCSANSDCTTGTTAALCAGTTDGLALAIDGSNANTIDNIGRAQVVNIFSKNAVNWSDFGGYFTAKPIVACLRHAGSGTHATLDKAVMRGTDWGKALSPAAKTVANYNPGFANAFWFNDGSADEMNCIDGQITGQVGGRGDIGAIGYADADATPGANVVAIKYNGVMPSRQAVRNGWYDFYANQNLYYNKTAHDLTVDTTPSSVAGGVFVAGSKDSIGFGAVLDDLANFAAVPSNIPNGTGPTSFGVDKTKYWATEGEMRWNKDADNKFVIVKKTPSAPQTP
jgi:hypothetical protein